MRIALLHHSAPPVVGGVESVMGHHARLMAAAGHKVRIVAARGEALDHAVEFMALPRVDSRHPDVVAVSAELARGVVSPQFKALTQRISIDLAEALHDIDVVIAHNVCSLNKNLALTAALHDRYTKGARGGRLIVWHHDLAWVMPRYRPQLHPGQPWDLLRMAWPHTGQVVVSEMRRQEWATLTGLAPSAIHIVPNGLDLGAFLKLETFTRHWFQEAGLLNAWPVLLLPVRITPRKNIELALRMLAALRRELPQAQLVVTGPLGAHSAENELYFSELRALRTELGLGRAAHFLAEQVKGWVPDAVIADLFHVADALFLPSREEGFGIPVLEAAFSRLPIFCTDIPPLRALAGTEATYFSPDEDPASLARTVADQLRSDPVGRLAARARAAYTWERIYARDIAPLLEA
jgi:glycosyltransferase involved in cell wall biosynthesis